MAHCKEVARKRLKKERSVQIKRGRLGGSSSEVETDLVWTAYTREEWLRQRRMARRENSRGVVVGPGATTT